LADSRHREAFVIIAAGFSQAGYPSCHPTNSVRALKEIVLQPPSDSYFLDPPSASWGNAALFMPAVGLSVYGFPAISILCKVKNEL